MRDERKILLPYLVVVALLIVSVALFAYDAKTIVDAEETEEDFSKILLSMGTYVSGLQQTQIDHYEYLLLGDAARLKAYEDEKLRSTGRISELRHLIEEDFRESLPKIDVIESTQARYFAELDRVVQARSASGKPVSGKAGEGRYFPYYLQQIQLLLRQTEADIAEVRQATNQNVGFSVKRAGASIVVVAVLLVVILGFGYRITSRAFAMNRELAKRLAHEATHDTLTLLPNRRYFQDWLERSIAMAQRNGFSVALYFIDLDGFKRVNDSFGHDAGDEVLRVATSRFQSLMRESDLLARLGGDEFAILVSQAPHDEELSLLAARIVASLAAPVPVGKEAASVGASIGIAIFPRDATSADLLMRAADEAMYRAKARGKNQYCFFAAGSGIKDSAPA